MQLSIKYHGNSIVYIFRWSYELANTLIAFRLHKNCVAISVYLRMWPTDSVWMLKSVRLRCKYTEVIIIRIRTVVDSYASILNSDYLLLSNHHPQYLRLHSSGAEWFQLVEYISNFEYCERLF